MRGRAPRSTAVTSGALHADPDRQLALPHDPAKGGRHPLPPLARWTKQLGAWGITPDTEVVIYDDQSGANAAARAWWMLRAVGHQKVAVLDGGLRGDHGEMSPLSTEESHADARDAYPATRWQRSTVDIDDVDAHRKDPKWKVLDVRSEPRYRGETEPIDPIAGHIPGAINLPFAENLDDIYFKAAAALRTQYQQLLGDTPVDRLIVHCGSGVTACHTLLALEAAGMHGASLYVGSWSEWCRNDARPREPRG
jgi:thiosulfate/3-mercaptopyruvate sulfurtransferase